MQDEATSPLPELDPATGVIGVTDGISPFGQGEFQAPNESQHGRKRFLPSAGGQYGGAKGSIWDAGAAHQIVLRSAQSP